MEGIIGGIGLGTLILIRLFHLFGESCLIR